MTNPVASTVISLKSASFGYADQAIVRRVDLTIGSGQVVALLGPNGSGKSTLVRGLLGLNEHLGGEVQLFDEPLDRFKDRYRLGYVPQRHTLSASVRATVEEIVATGRLPHQSLLARQSRHDKQLVHESLELVGLLDRAKEDVSTLSGGQQRRVLIARALASEPDVLIMDEPTAGVDETSQIVLADVLRRLTLRGTTMVIVTHELAALRGVVNRIVFLTAGRIRFDGSPAAYAEQRAREELEAVSGGHHHEDHPHVPAVGAVGPLDDRGSRHA
ncbi:metal ABC transporter ATP-binding protein [Luteipulveratus mongoliensis]|uniref:Zinc ABC transporter ATPase n=1 Tax=Luteipulveratus mongoliensis TaxID=571913 RepID=A0A0K1JJ07_9MICO|nr:metal ABC transporter ATP-binding protein [Luteipulveratus mongoliensis]AKU16573.1 zinc ABC transporter ATPase [Luteipulveratus mongoliensis]